jgi:hypothetical protein
MNTTETIEDLVLHFIAQNKKQKIESQPISLTKTVSDQMRQLGLKHTYSQISSIVNTHLKGDQS